MDSSNKIAPLEKIETISSNLEVGNQNAPPTFSKTEHSSVQQQSDATDIEIGSIHHVSWLFGIVLTCAALLSTLIVPWHNHLKEPFYIYELYVYNASTFAAILIAAYIIQLEYWAGIKYDKKLNLFFFLISIGGVLYAVIALLYNYFYVYYFELFAPAPYGGLLPASMFGTSLIPILFFRYHYT